MESLAKSTLGDLLDKVAEKFGRSEALVDAPTGRRYTYNQLNIQVDALAKGLLALGLQKGECLAIWAPNRSEWVIIWFAAAKCGLVMTTVDTSFDSQKLSYQLNQADCRVLVMAPGVEGDDLLQSLAELCPEIKKPAKGALSCSSLPDLKHVVVMGGGPPGTLSWEGLRDLGKSVTDRDLAKRQGSVRPDDAATLIYTSGTTGRPKGVISPHQGLLGPSLASALNQGLSNADRLCVSVPMSHMFGCICVALTGMLAGATLVIPGSALSPGAILNAVGRERCTALYGPPTLFLALMDLPEFKAVYKGSVKKGIIAGAQCPIEVMKKVMNQMGVSNLINGYGQTEASSWIAQTRPRDSFKTRVSTVGKAVPGVEVKVVDPATGQETAPGHVGEICARGFNMSGYHKNPAATASALDAEGWLHTGDMGSIDQRGNISISGRLKEVIRKGGKVIFPAEIEELLFTHPKVNNAQVFGIPHATLGEEVAAWIKPDKGTTMDVDEIIDFLKSELPETHLPRHIKFVDEFPMTPLGKIQKFKMREIYAQELSLNIHES